MKFITTILSFYIILLTCKPCVDGNVVVEKGKQQVETQRSDSEHSDDSCSPFCICSCCGVQILNFAQPVVYTSAPIFTAIKSPTPDYKSVFAPDFYGSIWQPPQIS